MFARIKKSGRYQYLQIVHNERVNGKVRQHTIATLGRLDLLQQSGQLDGVVSSLAKYAVYTAALSARRQTQPATGLRIGPVLVFDRLWEELGVRGILEDLLARRRYGFPVERVIFTTVLHRLFVSGSDRAAETWCRRYAIPGMAGLGLHHFYRSMAWLGEVLSEDRQEGSSPFAPRCVKDLIEEELFHRRRDLFSNLEVVFFDTTSLYFEGQGGESLGQRGNSKDKRPDLPQMVVGMVLDDTGRPLCCEMWPGNTADVTTLLPVINRLRVRFGVRDVCIVADRGMIAKKTISEIRRTAPDVHYILGARMRAEKEIREHVLSRGGRYQVVHGLPEYSTDPSPLKVKEVWVEDRRYIVCCNEDQARRDRAQREAILSHLEQALKRGDKSLVGNRGFRRYLRVSGSGRFEIDQKKACSEARYDGKWVLRTDTDLPAAAVALKYKQLWMVEHLFRQLKSLLRTRPIYHRSDAAIRGHVFCSFLALLLLNELFKRLAAKGWTDVEWGRLKEDLDDVERFRLTCSGKTFEMRTDLPGDAVKAFRAVGVSPGPVIRLVSE